MMNHFRIISRITIYSETLELSWNIKSKFLNVFLNSVRSDSVIDEGPRVSLQEASFLNITERE